MTEAKPRALSLRFMAFFTTDGGGYTIYFSSLPGAKVAIQFSAAGSKLLLLRPQRRKHIFSRDKTLLAYFVSYAYIIIKLSLILIEVQYIKTYVQ